MLAERIDRLATKEDFLFLFFEVIRVLSKAHDLLLELNELNVAIQLKELLYFTFTVGFFKHWSDILELLPADCLLTQHYYPSVSPHLLVQ